MKAARSTTPATAIKGNYTMLPTHRTPTHPGIVLRKEFLEPLGIRQIELSKHLEIPIQRINGIVRGRRAITPETAWLLAEALGTTPEFWINLQTAHDLALSRPGRRVRQLKKVG